MVHGGNGEYLSYMALENGVLNLLKELAGRWRIILYFDSLQWMDIVSRRLLQRVMIELGNRQVFMIATCRIDGEQDIRGLLAALRERDIITTLPLSCFTEAETTEIAGNALQGCGDAGISTREIFLRTEGNALVLMDTLNMIRQDGWKEGRPLPENRHADTVMAGKAYQRAEKGIGRSVDFCGACGAGGAGAVGGNGSDGADRSAGTASSDSFCRGTDMGRLYYL